MTIKGFGPTTQSILEGNNKLTDYERETLTILQEECAEVVVVVSKLLRFGWGHDNPATGVKNNTEFCRELGHLFAMLDRVGVLPFYDDPVVLRGYREKKEKLIEYTQFAP